MNDPASLAERLFAAVAAGDVDTVRGLYAPDAVIWHNYDGMEQTVEENLATLAWMARALREFRYTEVRRGLTTDGFVQQHVITATNRAGDAVAVPACLVATVADGRITRIDEYVDSVGVAAITAK